MALTGLFSFMTSLSPRYAYFPFSFALWLIELVILQDASPPPPVAKDQPKQDTKPEVVQFKFVTEIESCALRYVSSLNRGPMARPHLFALLPSVKLFYISPPELYHSMFSAASELLRRRHSERAKEMDTVVTTRASERETLSHMVFQIRDATLFVGESDIQTDIFPRLEEILLYHSYKQLAYGNFFFLFSPS